MVLIVSSTFPLFKIKGKGDLTGCMICHLLLESKVWGEKKETSTRFKPDAGLT
jgi:hypothetical protein